MKFLKPLIVALVAGLALVALQAQQAAPTQAKGQAKGKMGMSGQMADHMAEMMGGHREMAELVTKITQSFAALEKEKDPALLATELAAHGVLLRELQAKVQAHSSMMDRMAMEKMEKEDTAPALEAAPEHKH